MQSIGADYMRKDGQNELLPETREIWMETRVAVKW